MNRSAIAAVCLSLGVSFAAAQEAPQDGSRLLYFQLPSLAQRAGAFEVEFQFRVDQQPYLVERVNVDPRAARKQVVQLVFPARKLPSHLAAAAQQAEVAAAATPALELLSREPARLAELYRIAAEDGRRVDVSVVIDGQTVRDLTFAELLDYNRALKAQADFRPLSLPSRLEGEASQPRLLQDCATCEASFPGCAARECPWWNATMSPTHCVSCWAVVQQCFRTCTNPPPPPCQPTVTTRKVVERTGTGFGPALCLKPFFRSYASIHITQFALLKETTIERTQHCDGSVTERVTGIRNVAAYECDRDTFLQCSPAFGFPFPCFI